MIIFKDYQNKSILEHINSASMVENVAYINVFIFFGTAFSYKFFPGK